jgi:hypothetical protein
MLRNLDFLSELSKKRKDLILGDLMNDIRGERLQVMLSPEELAALDDFRFRQRMPTRAAAVRELLKLGLTVATAEGTAGMKSSNYGVFNRGPDGHRQDDSEPDDAR